MRVSLVIPVIASILILVPLGFSQDALAANLSVTDQFGTVHQVDENMFNTVTDDGCLDGETPHHHADNGMGFVTSTEGVRINDEFPTMCGYGLVGGALTGEIDPPPPPPKDEFMVHIELFVDCEKAPPEFKGNIRFNLAPPGPGPPTTTHTTDCVGGVPSSTVVGEFGCCGAIPPKEFAWTVNTISSNGDEEKSCEKKLRVDKDNEITSKIRCGLKKALGTVIVEIFIRIIPLL